MQLHCLFYNPFQSSVVTIKWWNMFKLMVFHLLEQIDKLCNIKPAQLVIAYLFDQCFDERWIHDHVNKLGSPEIKQNKDYRNICANFKLQINILVWGFLDIRYATVPECQDRYSIHSRGKHAKDKRPTKLSQIVS